MTLQTERRMIGHLARRELRELLVEELVIERAHRAGQDALDGARQRAFTSAGVR